MATWSRSFDGKPEAVREARAFVLAVLDGHPLSYDVALVVAEFGANAITHTASGEPGGRFVVDLERCHDHIQVTVADMGAVTEPTLSAADPASPASATGRGLLLVDALSVKWGFERTGAGRRVWAILSTSAD